jgi:hypothetical protein
VIASFLISIVAIDPFAISPEVINRLLNNPVEDEQTTPVSNPVSIVPFNFEAPSTVNPETTVRDVNLLAPLQSRKTSVLGTLFAEAFDGAEGVRSALPEEEERLDLLYVIEMVLGVVGPPVPCPCPCPFPILDRFAFKVE